MSSNMTYVRMSQYRRPNDDKERYRQGQGKRCLKYCDKCKTVKTIVELGFHYGLVDDFLPASITTADIGFTQSQISNRFLKRGDIEHEIMLCHAVHQLIEFKEFAFPPIRVFRSIHDKWLTLDNRRLWCFKAAGLSSLELDIHFTIVCRNHEECQCMYTSNDGNGARKGIRERLREIYGHDEITFKEPECLCRRYIETPCYIRPDGADFVLVSDNESEASLPPTPEVVEPTGSNVPEIDDTHTGAAFAMLMSSAVVFGMYKIYKKIQS